MSGAFSFVDAQRRAGQAVLGCAALRSLRLAASASWLVAFALAALRWASYAGWLVALRWQHGTALRCAPPAAIPGGHMPTGVHPRSPSHAGTMRAPAGTLPAAWGAPAGVPGAFMSLQSL